MKATSLLFLTTILIINNSWSQYKTAIYERIDTIVTLDMETNKEDTRIVNSVNIYLDANNCESLPENFIVDNYKAKLADVKKLISLEFRCNGKYQRYWEGEWNVESFKLVYNKSKQAPVTIANEGFEFSKEIQNVLINTHSGEQITFEQISLVHPKFGKKIAKFTMLVE